jgi:cbb3-type cytochrome oxidase maturation protein
MLTFFLFTGMGFLLFLIGAVALVALIRSGQYDDLDTPALRMLADEEPAMLRPPNPAHSRTHSSEELP